MNSDREPISPPTSPAPHEEEEHDSGDVSDSNCEDSYTPADGSDGKEYDSDAAGENDDDDDEDDDEDNERNDSDVPSSPPTSVETGSKNDQRTVPNDIEISTDGYRAPAVETEDEDEDEAHHAQRDYYQNQYEAGNDTFASHRKNWENSSQWEDEDGEPSHVHLSSPPMARVQSQSSSRKSPSSPMFPPRPRQNTSSAKTGLSHQFSSRRSPASRASSGSYDPRELHRDEKKPPLVLLHVTLLLLPGAEEVVLRHLTPTTLERGVLIEHPRGDYTLLEELILDGLGLDDDFVEEPTEPEEPQEKTWEQALNISPSPPTKKAWQLRVYASNGLMTPGAWKRVWAEMERIDVEIWPRGYDRKIRSNRSSSLGGSHSRGTSTSSVLPYPSDGGMMDDMDYGDDGRRKSLISAAVARRISGHNSGSLNNLASSAPVPTSPGRARTPTAAPKSRRGRSRAPSTSTAGLRFDFNKLITPRAVTIYAGINLFLFLYFTVFRVINLSSAWGISIAKLSSPFKSGGMDGIQVYEVADGCPVEVSSESCGGSVEAVVADIDTDADVVVVGGEQRVLVDEEERDEESVPDPEIGNEDSEALAVDGAADFGELEGEEEQNLGSSEGSQPPIEDGEWLEQQEMLVQEGGEEVGEESPEDIQEGQEGNVDAEADVEVDVEGVEAEVEVEEEEVEERSKYSFFKGFGFS